MKKYVIRLSIKNFDGTYDTQYLNRYQKNTSGIEQVVYVKDIKKARKYVNLSIAVNNYDRCLNIMKKRCEDLNPNFDLSIVTIEIDK